LLSKSSPEGRAAVNQNSRGSATKFPEIQVTQKPKNLQKFSKTEKIFQKNSKIKIFKNLKKIKI